MPGTFIQPTTANHLRACLVGAWELESYMSVAVSPSTAEPIHPMTDGVQGMLVYTADGYMTVNMYIPGQRHVQMVEATEADWAEAGRRFFGYSGVFYVAEEGGALSLRHQIRIASRPDMVGDTQSRAWRLEDRANRLVLYTSEPINVKGVLRRPELRWKRLKDIVYSPPQGKP